MAASEGTEKTSMLDAVVEKIRVENRKQVLHCTTSISRLSVGIADKRDIGTHYERLFRSCRQRYQGDAPTGLLLVYPQHCVHLMEAPWDVLRTVVQDLEEMESKGGFLKDSKLLNFDSNIDQRLYPQWAYRVLNLPTLTKGESYKTQEPIEQTVATCLESLYKLGVHLSKLQQHQLKVTMDALPEKMSQYLPRQDMLEYFIGCSELNSPAQFVERYCRPTQIVLDSEIVWPLPVRLFPYDD